MYYARPVPEANSETSIGGIVLCVVIIFIFVILFRGVRAQQQCSGPAVVYTTEDSGPAVMVPNVGYAEKSEKDSTSPQEFMPYNAAA